VSSTGFRVLEPASLRASRSDSVRMENRSRNKV